MAKSGGGHRRANKKTPESHKSLSESTAESDSLEAGSSNRANRTPKKEELPKWALPFLAHLKFRGSISAAATAARVGRRTVYDLRARNAWFDEMIDEIGSECIEDVESTLFQRAKAGVTDTAIIFYLKTRKPEIYGEKRLDANEIGQIRRGARLEVLAELHAEVAQLPAAARDALSTALSRVEHSGAAVGKLEAEAS